MDEFRKELTHLINRKSKENGSNTPDYILARFMNDCLIAFDHAVNLRTEWYVAGNKEPGSVEQISLSAK